MHLSKMKQFRTLSKQSQSPHTTIIESAPLRVATYNVRHSLTQHKFNTIITRCTSLQIDIIALQEVGDPVIDASSLTHHHIVTASSNDSSSTHAVAGVALVISNHLKPRCRSYLRSTSGRIVGVIIDINTHDRMLIVSAYMPTGLDGQSDAAPSTKLAHSLYREIIEWSLGMQRVIVMGDLNETLTPHDRTSSAIIPPPPASLTSPMHALISDGYIDEYRRHHSDASMKPGHTYYSASHSSSSSRIDYIWTKGIDHTSSTSIHIDTHLYHHVHMTTADHLLFFLN